MKIHIIYIYIYIYICIYIKRYIYRERYRYRYIAWKNVYNITIYAYMCINALLVYVNKTYTHIYVNINIYLHTYVFVFTYWSLIFTHALSEKRATNVNHIKIFIMMKFSIKDYFSKCDQIHSFLQIWSHLLKKSLMEGVHFLYSDCELKKKHFSRSHLNMQQSFKKQKITRKKKLKN